MIELCPLRSHVKPTWNELVTLCSQFVEVVKIHSVMKIYPLSRFVAMRLQKEPHLGLVIEIHKSHAEP